MSRTTVALATALAPVIALLAASPALGCGHSMRLRLDPEADMMRVVRKDIRDHRYRSAARRILRSWPDIRTRTVTAAARSAPIRRFTPLFRADPAANLRQVRVAMATAVVRSNGRLRLRHGWSGKTPRHRLRDLRWAARVLREERARAPRNVVIQSRLAEALSRLPFTRAEAWVALTELAEKGTLPEAMAYAALADLRAEMGDRSGRNAALHNCRKLGATGASCRRYMGKRTLHVAAVARQARR